MAVIGQRFKAFRTHLNWRQEDIAKHTGLHQNIISRIENGKGGTIETLLTLIDYYKNFYFVDNFLADHFVVIELNSLSDEEKLASVAIERIQLLKGLLDDEIGAIIQLLRH